MTPSTRSPHSKSRREFIRGTGTALAGTVLSPLVARAVDVGVSLPNVLFVIVDDLNRSLPVYGDGLAIAPNVARLAREGVVFERAFCQYPLCSPSRTSQLTALRPDAVQIWGNSQKPREVLGDRGRFLPEMLKDAGYTTLRIGKVFHLGRDDEQSWTHTSEGVAVTDHIVYTPREIESLGLKPYQRGEEHIDEFDYPMGCFPMAEDAPLADVQAVSLAERWLQQHGHGPNPFFFALGLRRPHVPLIAPASAYALFPPDTMRINDPTGAVRTAAEQDRMRRAIAGYYACVKHMDDQLGRVFATMDRLDLWKNTLVVFTADHGFRLGREGFGKMTIDPDSTAVPLVIRPPGGRSAARCAHVVENINLYRTILDYCGVASPSDREGASMRGLIVEPKAGWDRPALSQVRLRTTVESDDQPHFRRAVRTTEWTYCANDTGPAEEALFDALHDPAEVTNLAGEPRHAALLAELRKAWHDHHRIART